MSSWILMAISAVAVQVLAPKPVEYPFKQIEQGGFSRQRDQKLFVIRSPKDFEKYNNACGWEKPTPDVDWGSVELIAVHIGSAPSTGYGVIVNRIVKTGPKTVDVEVLKTTPPPGMMQAMHITYPFVVVSTQRLNAKVSIRVVGQTQTIRK